MPRSEAAKIVADSIARGKTTRDGYGEVKAALACRYYESVDAQIADMTTFYGATDIYGKGSDWHSTRPKSAYNMTRAVTDELGQLYHRPIKREFTKETDANTWEEISGQFNATMANIDRYTFLSGMVAARPVVMPDGTLRWTFYDRSQIEYVPDALDPTAAHWLVVSFVHGENTIKHWWSATHYVRTVDDIVSYTEAEEKEYPGGAHRYGRIPLVIFRNSAAGRSFYEEPASDLVSANRTINHMTTCLNWTMNFQGSSILVQVGGDPSKVLAIGPNSRAGLPEGASLAFISPDPAIDATIGAINHNLMMLCKSRRIPEDAFLLQRQGESGVAIVARQAALEDYRQGRAELFRPHEQDLIVLSLQVYAVHSGRSRIMPTIDQPSISYEKAQRPMSDAILAELMWKKQNNLISGADILMAEDPTLSREDALLRIEENKRENMAASGMVEEPVFKEPVEPDEDDAEDVTNGE